MVYNCALEIVSLTKVVMVIAKVCLYMRIYQLNHPISPQRTIYNCIFRGTDGVNLTLDLLRFWSHGSALNSFGLAKNHFSLPHCLWFHCSCSPNSTPESLRDVFLAYNLPGNWFLPLEWYYVPHTLYFLLQFFFF